MIVREHAGSLWLFDQADHSRLCGELAGAWGATPFDGVPAVVREAAATHDSGWTEWDRRPRLDRETRRPHPYSRMPPSDYREIWERGLARGWAMENEAGLLISLHAMRFFAKKKEDGDRQLLRRERLRQQEALRDLGFEGSTPDRLPEPYATWHEWMFYWDAFSLFLCEGWGSPWEWSVPAAPSEARLAVTAERSEAPEDPGGAVLVRPTPFRSVIELVVDARVISAAPYCSQTDLDAAVAAASQRRVRWRVSSASRHT